MGVTTQGRPQTLPEGQATEDRALPPPPATSGLAAHRCTDHALIADPLHYQGRQGAQQPQQRRANSEGSPACTSPAAGPADKIYAYKSLSRPAELCWPHSTNLLCWAPAQQSRATNPRPGGQRRDHTAHPVVKVRWAPSRGVGVYGAARQGHVSSAAAASPPLAHASKPRGTPSLQAPPPTRCHRCSRRRCPPTGSRSLRRHAGLQVPRPATLPLPWLPSPCAAW